MPRRKRLSEGEWEEQRAFILTRYMHDRKTLKQVRNELEERGFSVGLAQLEHRCKRIWGFAKNIDAKTWQQISSIVCQSEQKGHEFFLYGQRLDPARVKRETRRYRPPCTLGAQQLGLGNPDSSTTRLPLRNQLGISPSVTGVSVDGLTFCDVNPQQLQVMKRLPSSFDLLPNPLIGIISETELCLILHRFTDNLIERYELRLRDLINWVYNFIESFKAARLRADAESSSFQACSDGVWALIFGAPNRFQHFGHISDDDDERLLAVVSWLFAIGSEPSLLEFTVPVALECSLWSGHVRVARLLWSRMTATQRSRCSQKPWNLHRTASSRSSATLLLFRHMLSPRSPKWASVVLSSVCQYSSMDVFATLLPNTSQLLGLEARQSREALEILVTSCAKAEPEQLAISRLNAARDFLLDRGVSSLEDLINADAFIITAARGYAELFNYLVEVNNNPGIRDGRGFSALHGAAEFGQLGLCNQLLQISTRGYGDKDSCISALQVGLLSGHLEIVQAIEQHLQSVIMENISSEQWWKLLCSCSKQHSCSAPDCKLRGQRSWRTGFFEYCQNYCPSCISSNVHCNICALCFTALRASFEGRFELLEFCLSHGADPDWKFPSPCMRPNSPLDAVTCPSFDTLAKYSSNSTFPSTLPDSEPARLWREILRPPGKVDTRINCARLLFQRGMVPTERHLEQSLLEGEWDMAQLLIEQGVLPSLRMLEFAVCGQNVVCIRNMACRFDGSYHAESLCAAVFFSSECPVTRRLAFDLISRRQKQTPGNIVESTAIGLAAMLNDVEMLSRLLDAVPKASQLSKFPSAWLMDSHDNPEGDETYRELMIHQIKEQIPFWRSERSGEVSPLALAILKHGCESALILLRYGLKPDIFCCNIAVIRRRPDILSLLLRGQPELNSWPTVNLISSLSVLSAAVRGNDLGLVCQLLSAGADINRSVREVSYYYSPLQVAAENGEHDMVEFLLKRGADVNGDALAFRGGTALQIAVESGHFDVFKLLLDYCADINAPAALNDGLTCLQSVAAYGRFRALQLLTTKGVRTDGEYRLDYVYAVLLAERNSHWFVAQRLRSYGGWTPWDDIAIGIIRERLKDKFAFKKWHQKKIKIQASLELPRTADDPNWKADKRSTPIFRQAVNALGEVGAIWDREWPPSLTLSQGPLLEAGLAPQSSREFEFVDMSTPPPCLSDDEGWLQDWGPLFMRQQMGEEAVVDDTVD